MRLIQLNYFLTVAECKSITKAARRMYLSQPALSKQLSLLEEEIGVALMVRLPRGIELTDAGEQFAADCTRILEELGIALRTAARIGSDYHKSLRIGCFQGALIDDFLPELYQHIKNTADGMEISLNRYFYNENCKALENDEIDIMIELYTEEQINEIFKKGYSKKLLIKRKNAFIYSIDSPLAKIKDPKPEDFAKEIFYIPDGIDTRDMLVSSGIKYLERAKNVKYKTSRANNFQTMITNISLGKGYCLLAPEAVLDHPRWIAYELPDVKGLDVVAIWKQKNTLAASIMDSYRTAEQAGPE